VVLAHAFPASFIPDRINASTSITRGRPLMRESRTYGAVRVAPSARYVLWEPGRATNSGDPVGGIASCSPILIYAIAALYQP
jgi:hypothetical protein